MGSALLSSGSNLFLQPYVVESLQEPHAGKLQVRLERRTEVSARVTWRASFDPTTKLTAMGGTPPYH